MGGTQRSLRDTHTPPRPGWANKGRWNNVRGWATVAKQHREQSKRRHRRRPFPPSRRREAWVRTDTEEKTV